MFKYIQTAYNWVVSKATAAYQAVVNFFFGKEEEKEFVSHQFTEEEGKTHDDITAAIVALTEESTKEDFEAAFTKVEKQAEGVTDKVKLGYFLLRATRLISGFTGKRGAMGRDFDSIVSEYSPVKAQIAGLKDRYNALLKRYEEAKVEGTEYSIIFLAGCASYEGCEVKDLKKVLGGDVC